MSNKQFLDFDSLSLDTLYGVETVQSLNGSAGLFYLITVRNTISKTLHYMNIREGTLESPIYNHIFYRNKDNKKFTFMKTNIEILLNIFSHLIVVTGVNNTVELT